MSDFLFFNPLFIYNQIIFKEKLAFTVSALLIFLVMSQMPIYGAQLHPSDPFYHQRLILASNRGTITELGISPIVTSGMFLQFLEGAHIISLSSYTKGNKNLNRSVQKLAALALAILGYSFLKICFPF